MKTGLADRVYGQESSTRFKVQSEADTVVAPRRLPINSIAPKLSNASEVGSGTAAVAAESDTTVP
jgi:hypothetical protein